MEETIHKNQLSDNCADHLLCLALDVGEGMLRNGGEISRVEDTIERICYAYGAAHVEVFTIISVIHAAIRLKDGSYSSQMRRVKSTGMNLGKLEQLNDLSRRICRETPDYIEINAEIKRIKKSSTYPFWADLLAPSLAVGGFTVFFGGGIFDTLIAVAIGLMIWFIDSMPSPRLNAMAKTVISSFIASFIATAALKLGANVSSDYIIIGVIMLLVPGVSFGTALKDLLCGDILAGTMRTMQACLGSLMIAFGYMLAITVLGGAV